MFVLTIDQIGSAGAADLVPELLAGLVLPEGIALAFERTAGDEVQGLVTDPAALRILVARVLRTAAWSIGIGIGSVDEPLPASTREASGPAYVAARRAVERAKNRRLPARVAVEAADADAAAQLEAAWHLLALVMEQRSDKMWAAIDTVSTMKPAAAAEHLGITHQALSERLRRAGWLAERNAYPLLDALAARADA